MIRTVGLIRAYTYHYTNMALCNVQLYSWMIFFACLLPLLSGEYTVLCVIFFFQKKLWLI